jgi:hypothetical protein
MLSRASKLAEDRSAQGRSEVNSFRAQAKYAAAFSGGAVLPPDASIPFHHGMLFPHTIPTGTDSQHLWPPLDPAAEVLEPSLQVVVDFDAVTFSHKLIDPNAATVNLGTIKNINFQTLFIDPSRQLITRIGKVRASIGIPSKHRIFYMSIGTAKTSAAASMAVSAGLVFSGPEVPTAGDIPSDELLEGLVSDGGEQEVCKGKDQRSGPWAPHRPPTASCF